MGHRLKQLMVCCSVLIYWSCDECKDEPAVVADFSMSSIEINAGDSIDFTNMTVNGDPDRLTWEFEGALVEKSNEQNPTVIFSQAGTLTVRLTAFTDCSDNSVSKTITVNCVDRENDLTFTSYMKTENINYGTDVFAHNMDIYQPLGDDRCTRPAMLLLVGGGVGNPNDLESIESMAVELARNGFLVAVGRYRSDFVSPGEQYLRLLIQNTQDAKAGIRYLRENAEKYRIDPELIFNGGHGSGAIISLFASYITYDELGEFEQQIVDAEGGLEGEQGNPDVSSHVAGTFASAGAVFDITTPPTVIDAGEPPVFVTYGELDRDILPGCENLGGSYQCGSEAIYERAQAENIYSDFYMYEGGDHSSPRLDPTLYTPALVDFLKELI